MDAAQPPAWAVERTVPRERAVLSDPLSDAGAPLGAEDDRARLGRWLSRALQAERAAVVGILEARHGVLVQQLEQRAGPSVAPTCAPARPMPDVALVDPTPTVPGSVASGEEAPAALLPDLAWDPCKLPGRSAAACQRDRLRTSELSAPCRRTSAELATRVASTVFRVREESTSPLGRLVSSTSFEAAGAALVMLLAVCMALESQYAGLELGFQLGYGTYARPAARVWPWAVVVLDVMNWALGIAFCVELALKLIGFGVLGTFKQVWSVFDALITMLWIAEVVHLDRLIHSDVHLLRVFRIFRLVRFIRLVKTIRMLDSLYLIYTALAGSVAALGWSIVILFLLQVLVAFVLTETLSLAYFYDDSYDQEGRRRVFEYFGTFTRAVLSTFEMTLANWPQPCRLLTENVSEWFVLLCLAHKLTVGFAVVAVINGVFIQETFKCAHDDDLLLVRQKERAIATHGKKMRKLFEAADEDGNGALDSQEFKRILQHRDVRTWLTAMDYDIEDTDVFFSMLDKNGSSTITPEEFVCGIMRLRGGAKSIDVKRLLGTCF